MSHTDQTTAMLRFPHDRAVDLAAIPHHDVEGLHAAVVEAMADEGNLMAFFGRPVEAGVRLTAVVGHRDDGTVSVATADVGDRYRSFTPDCPQAHWFEREIAEQWGAVPEGHPWLKPIRFHSSYRPGHDAWSRPSAEGIVVGVQPDGTRFYRIEGEEVHEVAVGPIHAGVIEPGHFRFQCHGEHVFHLEISLGYQHRGIEKALWRGPNKRTAPLMEGLAGDTSVGHVTAYSQAIESLTGVQTTMRANSIRAIALELERLANHTGDLGALAGDVGYLPTMAFCGRLRGDFLNSTAALCGNRFGRGLVRPGGVTFDFTPKLVEELTEKLTAALRDVEGATDLLFDSPSVESRFDEAGAVSKADAEALGLVGPAARACGVDRDVRVDFPNGAFRFEFIPISTRHTGDVFGRAYVRNLEVKRSGRFILELLRSLPAGELRRPVGPVRPNAFAVGLVEGWRGEICHVVSTDAHGKFAHYKVVDPSFHNWVGLMMALRDQAISDFPLCNKSFNLSYCGHDL